MLKSIWAYRGKILTTIGSVGLLALTVFVVTHNPQKAFAASPACSAAAAAQNGISVAPSHGQAFYIDSGASPKLDAGYIGYRVTNSTGSTQGDLWGEVGSFTGGALSLSNSLDNYQKVTSLTNGSTSASYFLLKASAATTTPQTHHFKVWSGRPDLPNSSVLYDCIYTFSAVKETIKAAANKVQDTGLGTSAAIEVSNTSPQVGQTITVTVEGATGTIGAGASPDGSIVWLTPAAVSSWPTRSLRLESVSVIFERNTANGQKWTVNGDQVTYTDQLIITNAQACLRKNATNCSGGTGTTSPEYRATYTFRVVGIPTSSVKAVPVAQIASGTQIKHADTTAVGSTIDISFGSVSINASLTKSVTATTGLTAVTCSASCVVPGGVNGTTYVAVPYRLTATSTNATAITIDEIVDQPQTGTIYKTSSAKITDIGRTNVTTSDPSQLTSEAALNPRPLHYVGPFNFSSATSAQLDYQMWVPNGSYVNTAYAKIGDLLIGATTSAMSKVTVTSDGSGTVTAVTTTQSLGIEATTDPATNVSSSGATINGTVDPNGANPLIAQFEYSTSPTLSGSTTVTATTPASGNLNGLTDPTTVSYSLTGLSSNTTYYYRVKAGAGVGTILSFTTNAVVAPPTVTTVTANLITSTGATLNGTINPNLTSVLAIDFIYGTSPTLASGNTTVTLDDGSGANLTASGASTQPFSTAITGLTNGTTYYFKLRGCTVANCSSFIDGSILSFVAANPPSNPVLSVTKSHNIASGTVSPGQLVSYTVAIANNGGATGTTSFTDTIPTGFGAPSNIVATNCGSATNSYSAPTLTLSALTVTTTTNCIVTYDLLVNSPLNEGTTLTNSADVAAAAEGGNNPAPVSASTLTVNATPNLSTSTKSVSDNNGGNVLAGDTLTYTITLINTGDGRATGVTATDTIDTDTQNLTNVQRTNCGSSTNSSTATALNITSITVDVGTNCVITFDVTVKSGLTDHTAITNTATIGAATEGGSGATPSSTTLYTTDVPALVVANSENDADNIVTPNQTVTYTVTIQNTSSVAASGITATSAVSGNATLNTGSFSYTNCGSPGSTSTSSSLALNTISVAAGTTCTITYTTTVKSTASEGAPIANSIDVSAATQGGNDPAAANASTLTVDVTPNLSTSTKSVSDNNGGSELAGDTLTYTITVINTGDGAANGVSVTDTIDTDTQSLTNVQRTNCGSSTNSSTSSALNITGITVGVGTNCVITFDVTVKSGLTDHTAITNTATVGAATEGGSGATPSSSALYTTDPPALTVTNGENDADNIVTPGQVVTYTATIQNTSTGAASSISATGTISSNVTLNTGSFGFTNCGSPSNSSTSSSLALSSISVAASTTCTITYTTTVKSTASEGATIDNSFDASAATEGGNNPAAANASTLTVNVTPNLSTSTKAVTDNNGGNVLAGDTLTYTITVINTGDGTANGVAVTDTIDTDTQNLTNVQRTNCGSSTNSSTSSALNVTGISVAVGTNCVITFDVTVKSSLTNHTALTNTATIGAATEGGSGATPSSTTLYTTDPPALVVTHSEDDADNTVTRNQTVTYTITIQNTSTAQASSISASSTIDSDVTLNTSSFNFTSCGTPGNTSTASSLALNSITVAAGATCTITYQVSVENSAANNSTIPSSVDVSAATEGGNDPAPVSASTLTVSVPSGPNTPTNSHFQDGATNLSCSGLTKNRAVRVGWDSVATAVDYEVSLDGGSATSTSGNTYYDWTMPAVDGVHTFAVRAKDGANATSAWSSNCSVTLDQTAPTVDAGTDKTTNAGFTQSSSSASDANGISSYSWTKVSGPGSVNFDDSTLLHPVVSATTNGTYVIRLTVTDNAGNSASDTFTLVWSTSGVTVDAGANKTTKTAFTQDATIVDNGGSGIATRTWSKVSGPGNVSFTNSTDEDPQISVDTDGVYVLKLTVTDNASNSANDTFTLTWDTTPPVPTIDTHPASLTKNTNSSFTFSGTDNMTPTPSIAYECKLDTAIYVLCTSPNTFTASEGSHTFYVRATDLAGNESVASYTWFVDITPPVIAQSGAASVDLTVGDTYSDAGATATDNHDGNVTSQIVTHNNVNTAQAGSYTVTYDVTDAAGNVATTVTRTVIVNDNDGAQFSEEQAAPNSGDGNNDGTPDSDQKAVTSFVNPVTNTYAVLENTNNCQNTNVNQEKVSDLAKTDTQYQYPVGLMNFTLVCGAPGMTTTVNQYYYGLNASDIVARKFDTKTDTYTTITSAQITDVTIGGVKAVKISYSITDGGTYDEDGLVNGQIVDPSGPAVLGTTTTTSTSSKSSSLPQAPNTGFKKKDIWAPIALLLVSFGLLAAYRYYGKRAKQHN